MKLEVEIEEHKQGSGLKLGWEKGFSIEIKEEDNVVTICANKEGLVSLARLLLTLGQDTVEAGTHIHLDKYNSLEEDSTELIIQKVK